MAGNSANALAEFEAVRRRLFGIAYRMLGSVADAEDLLQDVWLRWHSVDNAEVRDSQAFLVTITTRLAISKLDSAQRRRETYVGTWLPEPVDTSTDPLLGAERAGALSTAMLLLLERLSAKERAAFILREAFDYDYARIANILDLSEANARQLLSRAHKHLAQEQPAQERSTAKSNAQHKQLLEAFIHAARTANVAAIESLLAEAVVSLADGGGVVPAAAVPLFGRDRLAKVFAAFAQRLWLDMEFSLRETNGAPSVLLTKQGVPFALASFETSGQEIQRMYWVLNPEKLRRLS